MFGSIGMAEMIIILVIALIILEPRKLPDRLERKHQPRYE